VRRWGSERVTGFRSEAAQRAVSLLSSTPCCIALRTTSRIRSATRRRHGAWLVRAALVGKLVSTDTLLFVTNNPVQLAALVASYIDGHPYAYRQWGGGVVWMGRRPTPHELADGLLAEAEAQALALGSFLTTPEGEVIAAGVAMVIPSAYALDYRLFVDALKLASREQQRLGRERAGKVALVAVAALAVFALASS
jgi:hypothetical protein